METKIAKSTIYTKKGDDGTTASGTNRVSKSNCKVRLIGAIDEFSSHIGSIRRDLVQSQRLLQHEQKLIFIQCCMMDISSWLNMPDKFGSLDGNATKTLERWIDELSLQLPKLKKLIVVEGPIHVVRAKCREVEREMSEFGITDTGVLQFINRCSDFLFMLARLDTYELGMKDYEYTYDMYHIFA